MLWKSFPVKPVGIENDRFKKEDTLREEERKQPPPPPSKVHVAGAVAARLECLAAAPR